MWPPAWCGDYWGLTEPVSRQQPLRRRYHSIERKEEFSTQRVPSTAYPDQMYVPAQQPVSFRPAPTQSKVMPTAMPPAMPPATSTIVPSPTTVHTAAPVIARPLSMPKIEPPTRPEIMHTAAPVTVQPSAITTNPKVMHTAAPATVRRTMPAAMPVAAPTKRAPVMAKAVPATVGPVVGATTKSTAVHEDIPAIIPAVIPVTVRKTVPTAMPTATPAVKTTVSPTRPEKPVPLALCGSHNMGNTCFLNSTIQCLLGGTRFNRALLEWLQNRPTDQQTLLPTAACYAALVQWLGTGDEAYRSPIQLSRLKDTLCQKKALYCGYGQQDAQECMTDILDTLLDNPSNPAMNQFLSSRLGGTFRDNKQCRSCGYVSFADSAFKHFVLPLTKGAVTLEALLQAFFTSDIVTDYRCSKCSTPNGSLSKQMTLASTAPTLVFVLDRFDHLSLQRVNTVIRIPHTLELAGKTYELMSTANHWGGVQGGHYTAYAKRGTQWFLINDSAVQAISPEQVTQDPSVYILLYEQM